MAKSAPRVKKRKMNDLTFERIQQIEEQKRLGLRAMYRIPTEGGLPEFKYFNVTWPGMEQDITFDSIPDGKYVFALDAAGVPVYQWVEVEA